MPQRKLILIIKVNTKKSAFFYFCFFFQPNDPSSFEKYGSMLPEIKLVLPKNNIKLINTCIIKLLSIYIVRKKFLFPLPLYCHLLSIKFCKRNPLQKCLKSIDQTQSFYFEEKIALYCTCTLCISFTISGRVKLKKSLFPFNGFG